MAKDIQAVWKGLNARQRTYLEALYDCDQAKEADRRARASQGFYDRTPASEWRWVMYGPEAPPSALYLRLDEAGLIDQGTGATWQALETRGLLLTRTRREELGEFLEVQITALGRKVVRAIRGEQRQKPPPKGQLRERQWAALVRLYAAGEGGVDHNELLYGRGGFDWMRTLLRLRDYQPEPLMEQYHIYQPTDHWRIRITPYGRSYYEQEWARYHELYPEVEAPEPEQGNKEREEL
jgi:hypothetical protein